MIAGALFSFDLLSTVRFDKRSFQNCLKTGKLYAFRQLLELTTLSFRAA